MRLYLVRHAQAESNHPLGDAARRLTAEGRDAFRAQARALAPELAVARILTSPYVRAAETARLLAAATGAGVEAEEALGSGRSDGQELIRIARLAGDGTAVVGHNPEISEAVRLAGGGDASMPPGAVACLEFDPDGDWPRLAWLK